MGTDKTEQKHLSSWCRPGEMTKVIYQRKTFEKTDLCGNKTVILTPLSRLTPFCSESICEIREIRGQFLLVPATPG